MEIRYTELYEKTEQQADTDYSGISSLISNST